MTFGNYIYSDNTQQSRQAAINQIIDTADKLEAGHLKAVETASTLYQSIATLPFNEEEEPLRQQLVNEVKNVIDNNTQYGNMYPALDKILKFSGELLIRKDVTSAIRNQEAYKQFIDNIDKRTDIPLGMKEFYKEKNPYNREEVRDDNNNVTYYKNWQVTYKPTSHIDGTVIADKAIQRIKASSNTNQYVTYLDANFNPVKPGDPNAIGVYFYNTETRQYEAVSAEDLYKAVIGIFKEDPMTIASINQEKDWIRWMKDNGEDVSSYGLFNTNGTEKSPDEYLLWKFNQTTQAAAWYKNLQGVDINQLKTIAGDGIINPGGNSGSSIPTNNVSGNAATGVSGVGSKNKIGRNI